MNTQLIANVRYLCQEVCKNKDWGSVHSLRDYLRGVVHIAYDWDIYSITYYENETEKNMNIILAHAQKFLDEHNSDTPHDMLDIRKHSQEPMLCLISHWQTDKREHMMANIAFLCERVISEPDWSTIEDLKTYLNQVVKLVPEEPYQNYPELFVCRDFKRIEETKKFHVVLAKRFLGDCDWLHKPLPKSTICIEELRKKKPSIIQRIMNAIYA